MTEHEPHADRHEEVWRAVLTGQVRGLNVRRLVGWMPAGPRCKILVSSSAAHASELDTSGLELRTLALRGREESAQAWVAAA
jgi:hypothetical protein